MSEANFKVKDMKSSGAWATYKRAYYGDIGLGKIILTEVLVGLFNWVPGLYGLAMRKIFYPLIFPHIGKKVVFGRNITIRHPHKIKIGSNVIIDDNVVLDAKGEDHEGIVIGDRVFLGRNSIVYCKGGDIKLADDVNISSNCQIFSSNDLSVGKGTVIGAFTYLLSGGEYDYKDATPFAEQSGQCTKGPLSIGTNCWLGARISVLDAANVGDNCVLAAGAVVNKPIPENSIAAGVPAKVLRSRSDD